MGPGGYRQPAMSDLSLPAIPPWALSLQNGGRRASSGDLLTSEHVADSTVMSMPDLTSRAQSGPEMTTSIPAANGKIANGEATGESSLCSSIDVLGDDEDDNGDTESELSEMESPEPARIMSDIMTDLAHIEAQVVRVQSEPSAATKPPGKSFASSSKIMALEGLWQEQHTRDQAAQNHVPKTNVDDHNNAVNSMIPRNKPSASKKRRISVSSSSGSDIPDFIPDRQSSTASARDAPALSSPEHKRLRVGEVNGVSALPDTRLTEQDLKKALLANKSLPSDSGPASMGGTSDSDIKPSRTTAKATLISRRVNNVPSFESSDEDEDFEDADDDDDEDEAGEEEDIDPSRGASAMTEEQNTPAPAASAAEGPPPEHILYATDGRLYTTFPGLESGATGKSCGAVFPTGYKLYDSPVTPFICAVRDCQRLLPTLMSFGAHYSAKHCRKTFNDNLDGTMTLVGTYTTPKGVSAPPIIVSQNPPGPDAPEPAEAMIPAYVMGRIRDTQYAPKASRKTHMPYRKRMVVTMKVPNQQGSSSSATPPVVPLKKKLFRPKSGSHLQHDTTPSTKPASGTPPADPHSEASNATPTDFALPDYGQRVRRRAAIEANAAIHASSGGGGASSSAPGADSAPRPDAPIRPVQPHHDTTQMILDAGNIVPSNILEMEDWEVAPGRIRDESSAIAENIAFSNSFVGSTQEIPISSDVSFNVLTIKPGGSVQFQANIGKLRVCSLAAGKLQVKIGPHEFSIGPNGMFKVRDSDSAVVTNRLYLDSVLHISSIKEY